jgi:hypothetical protein
MKRDDRLESRPPTAHADATPQHGGPTGALVAVTVRRGTMLAVVA